MENHNGCPGPAALAVYVERNLPEEELPALDSHLAGCEHCRTLVALIIKSQTAVPDPPIAHNG